MMMRYLQYYTVTMVTRTVEQITNGENTIKFLKLGEEFGGDVAEQVMSTCCNAICYTVVINVTNVV